MTTLKLSILSALLVTFAAISGLALPEHHVCGTALFVATLFANAFVLRLLKG